MARLIDCSIEEVVACKVTVGMPGKLKIKLPYGWKSHLYTQEQIASITPIDEEQYRSAGGAAAGAIIGGVLTGGIGLLIGGALGGRRRKHGTFLIYFDDGNHVAFEEKSGSIVKLISRQLETAKIKTLTSEADS